MSTIVLLGEPKSTQTIYGIAKNRIYMKADAKRLKRDYHYEARMQYKGFLLRDTLSLTLRIYFKTKRRFDCDNFNKLILDALTGVVYLDDSQVVALHIFKAFDPKNPRVEVTVH